MIKVVIQNKYPNFSLYMSNIFKIYVYNSYFIKCCKHILGL